MREKEIIIMRVRDAWKALAETTDIMGVNDPATVRDRAIWATLDRLFKELYPGETY